MIDFDFETLRRVGLTPALAQQLRLQPEPEGGPFHPMRVTEVHRESLRLHDGESEQSARTVPTLLRELAGLDTALAVGDWVLTRSDASGQSWVQILIPRLTHIVRRDADGSRHPVVSNVDTALLVMGLDDDFNLRRLERYLALVHSSGVTPGVVLTKADVASGGPDALPRHIASVRERVGATTDVLAVNGLSAAAATALAPYLGAGQTVVLLGSSGAGKSTLTNTLLGASVQDTGAVREHDSRGKHTTTSRSLHRLTCGACVIDTPGLRSLRPDVDAATLGSLFDDIQRLAPACRFRDCRHDNEPGCAVREAVAADRLNNFHKLLREARRDTLSALERRQQLSVWKARSRDSRERIRWKMNLH